MGVVDDEREISEYICTQVGFTDIFLMRYQEVKESILFHQSHHLPYPEERVQEFLDTYSNGSDYQFFSAQIDSHVKKCGGCYESIAKIEGTITALLELGNLEIDPPKDLHDRIMAQIKK